MRPMDGASEPSSHECIACQINVFFLCVLLYMYCVSHAFLIFVYFLPSYIFLTQNSKCAGLADSVEPPIQGLFVLGRVFAAGDTKALVQSLHYLALCSAVSYSTLFGTLPCPVVHYLALCRTLLYIVWHSARSYDTLFGTLPCPMIHYLALCHVLWYIIWHSVMPYDTLFGTLPCPVVHYLALCHALWYII